MILINGGLKLMLYLQTYTLNDKIAPMEPNIIQIDKQLVEYIEFTHFINDLTCEKMNVGEEIKLKEMSRC